MTRKGNQGYRGAVSKKAKKRTPPKRGSGAKNRGTLSGKGPTPKAEDRPYHAAYKRKKSAEGRAAHRASQERRRTQTAVVIEEGNELVVGRNPVMEAAEAGLKIKHIYYSGDDTQGRLREMLGRLATTGATITEVTRRDLDRASNGAVHQGLAIEVEEYEYWDLQDLLYKAKEKVEPGLLVALDQITDPHNVGAVLRSAAAFGADGMILPRRRSAGLGATAWKVSAGAAAHVPTARVTNLVDALNRCKDEGFFVVGLDGDADVSVRGLDLATEPLVVVTGAEGRGLSRLVRETCDLIVSIPTTSKVESLNAAVATGIVLYEVDSVRQTMGETAEE